MAVYTINTRLDAGLTPTVYNSSGSPRPLLAPMLTELTGHYTGAKIQYAGTDTAAVLRALNIIFADIKPNEYNWVVDQQGAIWEYAGDYMAAHSLGNNDVAIGVLILCGIGERPTDACVLAFRQLRYDLILRRRLAPSVRTIKHRDMGTTATQCPGYAVEGRWTEFLVPWSPPVILPPPPIEPPALEEDDMKWTCARWSATGAVFVTDLVSFFAYVNGDQLAAAKAAKTWYAADNPVVLAQPNFKTLKQVDAWALLPPQLQPSAPAA